MKNFKKIASAIAALSLAACMVAPVAMTSFAATGDVTTVTKDTPQFTLTIDDTDENANYEAYQIFKGDLELTEQEGGKQKPGVLSNIEWGSGINPNAVTDKNIYAALAEITIDDSNPFKKGGEALTSAKEVADVLGTETADSELAKKFAETVIPYLTNEKVSLAQNTDKTKWESPATSKLTPGYYLVQNKKAALKDKDGAYTRYMLQVLGDVETEPKKSSPSVDKQVSDNDESDASTSPSNKRATEASDNFYETADHAIGETFQFKLTANMPKEDELDEYKKYTLKFNDKMATGVTFEKIDSVKIYIKDVTEPIEITEYDATSNKNGYQTAFTGLTEETSGKKNYKGDGENTWTLTISDLVHWLTKDTTTYKLSQIDRVEVIYDAHLNDEAIVVNSDVDKTAGAYNSEDMKVNINDVNLEYSNNPNKGDWSTFGEGTPDSETGKTPEDTVGVFTYKVTSTKVDGASMQDDGSYNTKLSGAVFSLYAKDPKTEKTDNGAIKLVEVKKGSETVGYRLATKAEAEVAKESGGVWVTEITTPENGEFVFYGLDAGTYYIDEVTAPNGYNKLEKAVKVEIVAKHAETDDGAVTLELKDSKYDSDTATIGANKAIEGNIINNKGATLPSTGGIGTTLFYLGGGALVAVAGVMLITKKRMTKE